MSRSIRSRNSVFGKLFLISALLTLIIYVLRGIGLLTFIPGGIILILLALTLFAAILWGVDKTRRF